MTLPAASYRCSRVDDRSNSFDDQTDQGAMPIYEYRYEAGSLQATVLPQVPNLTY